MRSESVPVTMCACSFAYNRDTDEYLSGTTTGVDVWKLSKVKPIQQQSSRRYQPPDLQHILLQSYDYLTIMPKLRSTYDKRLIYRTSYEERKAFLRYDLLAKL